MRPTICVVALIVLASWMLSSCSSDIGKAKSAFVAVCSQGDDEAEGYCKCAFDKLEAHYGKEAMIEVARDNVVPPDFMKMGALAAMQCRGANVSLPPLGAPAGSDATSAHSGALGDSGDKTYGSGSPTTIEPASQAAQVQQSGQVPSQQAMQQAVQQDTTAQAQGGNARVTENTYGNVVASFYPGKSPLDAIDDALLLIHSELTVMDMAPSGYPEYQVECEPNGQCVGGTGTPMGAAADVAKEMFPVDPADVGKGGITCGQYVCNDGKGNVIGRNPSVH